jgi:hypothetical protein
VTAQRGSCTNRARSDACRFTCELASSPPINLAPSGSLADVVEKVVWAKAAMKFPEVSALLSRLRVTLEELVAGGNLRPAVATAAARHGFPDEAGNRCRPPRRRDPDCRHRFNPPPPRVGPSRRRRRDSLVTILTCALRHCCLISAAPEGGFGTAEAAKPMPGGECFDGEVSSGRTPALHWCGGHSAFEAGSRPT